MRAWGQRDCLFIKDRENTDMVDLPKLPVVPAKLVQTAEELARVCEHLHGAGRFAFDTEFIGENTYTPLLCLIQVATEERVELIDPMAISREKMRPFWELLADAAIEKYCHAGEQDVEIAWQQSALVAQNMFDTQIGAGMMGVGYPVALWRVVEHFTGVELEKAHTYSAWDRRPLSKAQFAYAVDDVRYLPVIYSRMSEKISELGHAGWMKAACAEMVVEAARPADVTKLFTKIRGAPGLKSEQLSVLRELAVLREQLAFEHDVPSRQYLKDEVLFDIASKLPESMGELVAIRDFPRMEAESYGEEILDAVARGLAVPEGERPKIVIPGEDSAEVKRLAETLWVAAQVICLGQSVTPALVTSQSEIAALARLVHKDKKIDRHGLMSGWHAECLGEKLAAFSRGELQIDLRLIDEELRAKFSG